MKRPPSFAVFCPAILAGWLLGLSGCGPASVPGPGSPDAANSNTRESVERVTAGHPVRTTLTRYTTQPGWIEAFEQTPLFSKIAGYVDEIGIDIGDLVTKDQTLVRLWVPEMQQDVEQQQALVAQAEAEIGQADAAVVAAKAAVQTAAAMVKGAEAGVGRANADLERWSAEYQRLKELASRGTVTDKLVDETRQQWRAAEAAQAEVQAAIEAAQAAREESQAKVQTAEADQKAAAARLKVAQANLARAQTMLQYREINAPFDGVITQRNVDTKHYVQPGSNAAKPLVVVARTDAVRVFVEVPEREAELVRWGEDGDPATVTIQALGNRSFDANVTRTSWSLDATNRTLRTEIDIQNEQGLLRPGMYATVRIRLDQRENVLALPVAALIQDGPEPYCCLVDQGKIEHRRLELGLRAGNEVEILSGINETDTVVLVRPHALTSGQVVEITGK
jgi:HlyD family secretion protein